MTPRIEYMGQRKSDPVSALGFTALQVLCGGPWYTVTEIADLIGVSATRISQLERAACLKLGRRLLAMREEVEAA